MAESHGIGADTGPYTEKAKTHFPLLSDIPLPPHPVHVEFSSDTRKINYLCLL
jgi:hypothetical protein